MLRIGKRNLLATAIFSWVSAWFAPAKARGRSFANIAEFRAVVISAFKAEGGVDRVLEDHHDPAKFKIMIGEWSSTADVTNMYGYLVAYPDEDVGAAVSRFVKSSLDNRTRTIVDDKLVAVIRTREYLDAMSNSGQTVLSEPLGADLVVLYMADLPDSMSPISLKDLPGKDLTDVRKIALSNVKKWLPRVNADNSLVDGVFYYVEDNTLLSTSLILLDDFWKSVAPRFPGDVLIALPRRDQLFIFDDSKSGRGHARRLISATFKENFNLVSPVLYARRNGKIVVAPD